MKARTHTALKMRTLVAKRGVVLGSGGGATTNSNRAAAAADVAITATSQSIAKAMRARPQQGAAIPE